MAERADESGFPRTIGRAPSQKEVAILVGRKRSRTEKAVEGDLVMLPVDHDDVLRVSIDPAVVKLLEKNVTLLEKINDGIQALLRR